MKYSKIFALLLCALLLVSCAENALQNSSSIADTSQTESLGGEQSEGSSEAVVYDTTPRELEFVDYYFGDSFEYSEENAKYSAIMQRNEDGSMGTVVIDSADDISLFIELLEFGDSVTEFFEGLDEDYFEKKLLLFNDITAPMSGYDFAVRAVSADENGVTVKLIYTHAEMGNDVVVPGVVAVEIDKSDILGCESFGAEIAKVDFDTTERELEYTSHSFIGTLDLNYVNLPQNSVVATKITNAGYFKRLAEGSSSAELKEYAKDKDQKFFQTKSLIIIYAPSSSSGNEFKLESVSCGEHGTALKINRILDGLSGDETDFITVVEVDAAEVFGNHSVFAAVSDGDEWQRIQKAPIYFEGEKTDVECEMDIIARETTLPLVATLKAIGADVNWTSDEKATVKYNGRSYTLSLKTKKLVRGNEDRLWGDENERVAKGKELIVNYNDFWGFMLKESDYDTAVSFHGKYLQIGTDLFAVN